MLKEGMRKIQFYKGVVPSILILFISLLIICTPIHEVIAQGPTVVSTSPANGATDVPLDLTAVSITFSKPMQSGMSFTTNFWPLSSTFSWSPNKMTLNITRTDNQKLKSAVEYTFTLNPEGDGFRDLEGNPLPIYTFSFTTVQAFDSLKISANPAKGFHWTYYLAIPHSLAQNKVLLVAPNNSGFLSDDPIEHEAAAYNLLMWFLRDLAMDLGLPLLVPAFPRPFTYWWICTHALDRDSLITDLEGLQRIDLQLIAMINDARERLASTGISIDERVFMFGFSASAQFTNRFTLLHPEKIKAATIGSTGWLTVPVSVWEDAELRYPVGIHDLEILTGQPFNLQYFRSVPQYSYVGDQDTNDAVDYSDTFDEPDRLLIYELFGDPQFVWERRLKAQQIFESVQSDTTFKIYPDVGHALTSEMLADVRNFFVRYNSSFPDVPTDYWGYDYINAIYNAQITTGCSKNPLKYCPENNVTRQEMAAFIVRAVEGEPPTNYCDSGVPFPDVSSDMWSCRYIKKLKELGITTGYRDGTYGPSDHVSREEMATFLVRAVEGEPPLNYCDSGSLFPDVTPDMWSCKYIKKLKELGITTGYQDGTYGPYDLVTRAQMAAFLSRAFLEME